LAQSLHKQHANQGPQNTANPRFNTSPYKLLARILTPHDSSERHATITYLKDYTTIRNLFTSNDPNMNRNTLQRHHDSLNKALNAANPIEHHKPRPIHAHLATILPPLKPLTELILEKTKQTETQAPPIPADPPPLQPTKAPRRRPGRIIAYL